MLLTYNCILLKMSIWYSKHVEENIWRINNIKCITLVFCMVNSWCTVRETLSQSSTILNNNKYRNPTNMNRSPTGRIPIYPNRTNSNCNILHILRNKSFNNKVMRQNNKLKLKSYRNKPNVLKTLWKEFKSPINLPYLN